MDKEDRTREYDLDLATKSLVALGDEGGEESVVKTGELKTVSECREQFSRDLTVIRGKK